MLIEIVKCQHVGSRIRGRIYGITFAEYREGSLIEASPNIGRYKFDGFVDERLFVISYSTTIPRVKGAGTITLQGDSSGSVFEGTWGGFDDDRIISTRCIWLPATKRIILPDDKATVLNTVSQLFQKQGLSITPSIASADQSGIGKELPVVQSQQSTQLTSVVSRGMRIKTLLLRISNL